MNSGEYKRTVGAPQKSPNGITSGITGAGYTIDLVDSANNQFAKNGSGYFNLKSDVHDEKDCYYAIGYGHTYLNIFPNFSISKDGLDVGIEVGVGIDLISKTDHVVAS